MDKTIIEKEGQAPLFNSRWGVSSFIIAIVVGLGFWFCVMVISQINFSSNPSFKYLVFGIICFGTCVGHLTGIILACIGLKQQDKKKSYAKSGLRMNVFLVFLFVFIIGAGWAAKKFGLNITPAEKAEMYFSRGVECKEKGDLVGAMKNYTKAIEIDPQCAEAYSNRGVVLSDKGDYEGAIKDYNRAIQIDPGYELAYFNRGLEYYKHGDFDGADKDFSKALKIDAAFYQAYYNRGVVRFENGDPDGAIEDYTKAIQANPKDTQSYINRAMVRLKKGDAEGAVEDLTKALRVNPRLPNAKEIKDLINKIKKILRERNKKLSPSTLAFINLIGSWLNYEEKT